MAVRPHNDQHEAVEELPLVSEAATVTDVTAMDRDRREAVLDALERLLDVHNCDEWLASGEWTRDRPDWARLRAVLAPEEGSDLERRLDRLRERYERPYPMLVSVRFRTDDPFDYRPGQYVTLRYRDVSRPYSIASSPNADETELCVRRVPDGTLTPWLCDDLEPGDNLAIRGPNGEFLLESPSERDLVFLATGTGVAPFKSMIDYVFEEGWDEHGGDRRDVWLFLGAAWEDDLPYRDAFAALDDERENFHFVPTLSREGYLTDWEGETDYVQYALTKYLDAGAVAGDLPTDLDAYLGVEPVVGVDARIDPGSVEVYACGVSAMAYGLVDVAEAVGVPERHVHAEGYG
ncbi:ferredoxin--NADP reductase [Halomarina pelagica]|uniref:ferredoxin--NADP reductase n=1 Tax=Halomarina pelagica TaxID=2961599 RepID=UPI0020C42A99|nr:FAD-dependent oxidoreductase [Halomarina sp. BND7]